jgi:hypothetical protein
LTRKLGMYSTNILKPKPLEAAINAFENLLKRQYNPYLQNCEDMYEIPIPGTVDIPAIGLEAGFLKFTKFDSGIEQR